MAKESGIVGVIFKVTEMHIAVNTFFPFPFRPSKVVPDNILWKYCEKYGITREQLMVLPESVTNIGKL